MKPECTHDDSRVCQEGEAYDPNRHCRLCWLWDHDAAYHRAWGGPGLRTAAGPCRRKGAEARRVECPTCRGKVEVKVFACAMHGECTAAKPMPGLACCAGCADYEPPRPAANPDPGRVRHLLYHVYPHARDGGAVWRWNVAELKNRINLFNGRRVIGVALGPETEPGSAVREAFAGLGCEFVERQNVPSLGELATFPMLLECVAGFIGPDHATFYGHTKAVTSSLHSPTVLRWAESMYESCLDYWPAVRRALQSHPLAGSWKRQNFGWPGAQSRSRWHYSGTFRWSRNDDFYSRNWREIDQFGSGSESHPSLHFQEWEAAALIHEFGGDGPALYTEACWRGWAQPALERFRAAHAADRWTPLPSPSFAVVCIVHNEELLIDSFLDHYTGQGADKIILVDNECTDATAARARRRANVVVRTLASIGLDEELRTATFQKLREECAGRYDWVVLVDADEFIVPKNGETIRRTLALYTASAALGTEGWDVIQGPDETALDWTLPPLSQRRFGVRHGGDEGFDKPVVLRPGGPERLHCGQHRFRGPEPYPAEQPFRLFHLAAADEELFLRRRRKMTARQSARNVALGLSWQHTDQTEKDLRRRWDAAVADPRKTRLPG